MTCELLLMNKENIVLAADKTTILNGERIFDDVNKIFDFSGKYPMGFIVYGNPDFMSVPMEDFILNLKNKISVNNYENLEDLGYSLIDFIEEEYLNYKIDINLIKYEFLRLFSHFVKDILNDNGEDLCLKSFEEFLDDFNFEKYNATYNKLIENEEFRDLDKYFTDLALLFTGSKNYVKELLIKMFFRMLVLKKTGVVIGGFDSFNKPSFINFELITLFGGELIFTDFKRITYDGNNLILAFTQTKEIMNYLTGIHPDFQYDLFEYINDLYFRYLDKLNDFKKNITVNQDNKIDSDVTHIKFTDIKNRSNSDLNSEYNKLDCDSLDEIDRDRYSQIKSDISGLNKADNILKDVIEIIKDNNKNDSLDSLSNLSVKELGFYAKSLINITNVKYSINNDYDVYDIPMDIVLINKGGLKWFNS